MARLEGPGHEQGLARLRRGFHRSGVGSGRISNPRVLRKMAYPFGLLAPGAGIGASNLILLDASQRSDQASWDGSFDEGLAYYRYCRDAFQDGLTHILRGEPACRETLDADADGKAFAPYAPIDR